MYTAEAEESLLGGQPDFVLDAIDNIDTKVRAQVPLPNSRLPHQQASLAHVLDAAACP